MTRLITTNDFKSDIDAILTYLEREASARVAADYARRFRTAIEFLVDLPETGVLRPTLGPNIRIAIVNPYILVYQYMRGDETITLLRNLHGRRNITPDLLRR